MPDCSLFLKRKGDTISIIVAQVDYFIFISSDSKTLDQDIDKFSLFLKEQLNLYAGFWGVYTSDQ